MTKEFRRCYLIALAVVLALSVYPLQMGFRVLTDVLRLGKVMSENYPKYVIPYTPISLAVLTGTALLPLLMRARKPLLMASLLGTAVFFAAEIPLENVLVEGYVSTRLESWQMFMCYRPIATGVQAASQLRMPEALTEVEVLMGEYDPSFKLHFYLISLLLIVGLLSCICGYARTVATGDRRRLRLLAAQTAATLAFLAMCVLACFTAFFRDGSIRVSPLSAGLMAAFFILLGLMAGLVLGNALHGKRRALSILLPAIAASGVTLLMYIGELALLNGHLYRFGTGFFFDGLGSLVLAPADLAVILLSGAACSALLLAGSRE